MRNATLIVPIAIAAILAGCASSPKTDQTTQARTVERVPLQYRDASEIADRLRSEANGPGSARVVAETVTNSLILSGTADEIDGLKRSIAAIDVEG